jgi:glycosyltransferase involved in cell wall biosynthesis
MRIMYLTQWFEPEPNIVKGLAFVRALEAAGHQVTVVTGFPNYPTGKLYPGYRLRWIQRETVAGVQVVRLPLYPSHDASAARRALNFLSFFAAALVYGLVRRERYDLAYVYHPPITVGLAAALAGRVRRLPFVLDVQDLWPDTIAATGMVGAGRLVGWLGRLCDHVYRRAAAIVVQSDGMRTALIDRGVPAAKLTMIHNWSDAEFGEAAAFDEAPSDDTRFTLVYGGNLGRAQALETVVDAAALLQSRRSDIEIVLQGDGVEAVALRERAQRAGVTILRFEPRKPQREIIGVFQRADALLLHLADDPLFSITVPSKTQFYLSLGRPVVAGVAGEAADLLRRSGAAMVAPPGDAQALADAIAAMADTPRDRREAMGRQGLAFYREILSFDQGMARTLRLLDGTYAEQRPAT